MENSINNDLSKNGQVLADKAAEKVQAGIRDAKHAAKEAGSALSHKAEELQSDAGSAAAKVLGRAQTLGRHSMDTMSGAAQRTRDVASSASDSIITYTRSNPITALLIAVASGALLSSLVKVLKSTRD
jgi:ElaB/YqjD/DUF883 family membrane-anchored ribosome-binding protein